MTRSSFLGVVVGVTITAAGWCGWLIGATDPPAAADPGATSAVCVEALDYAQEGFANNADAMDAARRAVAAASRGDRAGVADATADLDAANDRVEGIVDDAARAAHACRAGAR